MVLLGNIYYMNKNKWWGEGPESEDELDDDIEIYPEFP